MKTKVDLILYNAKELLTLRGEQIPRCGKDMNDIGIIYEGAIAIDKGRIKGVGNSQNILANFISTEQIDCSDNVVMPGFVDPHTHPVFYHTRENEFEMRIMGKSYVEISQSGGGIRSSIAAVRNATEEELYRLAQKRIMRMISCGTTMIEAKSGYGLSTDSELKMLRVIKKLKETLPIDIVATFLGAHEFPTEYKDNREEYIKILIDEMLPAVANEKLAEYCDIFTEEHVYTVEESRRILQRAKELGFKIRMHADELKPIGGSELAAELGAVSADHLGAASPEGIRAMKESGVIPILLPGTIFSLGLKNYAKAREMIDSGLPVALATDYNPGSCNCDSMQFIITLATLQMKMTVAEAITAATINAAYSLGAGDILGSIEEGKQADILIMDMPSYRYLPYHFGSNNVSIVIKKGKTIYQNRDLQIIGDLINN
ncbi:MAG: imidazolonepropionase [Candidatus Cloacimonetes bacterium]|nr:imidazolonepropionase [Candidatus Cloacimonadota bacterium]